MKRPDCYFDYPRCAWLTSDCLPLPPGAVVYSDHTYDVPGAGEAIERVATAPAKALTYDDGKAPLAQLPWAAIEGLAMVQAYGHAKYKDFNNYRKGMEVSRNISCVLRHCKEYMEGHDKDAESGRHPLEHALTRLAFVLQNIHDGTAIDDRYKAPK